MRRSTRTHYGGFAAIWLCATTVAGSAPAPARADLIHGKVRTGRAIELTAIVDGSPEVVFGLWSTRDGVNRFFGSSATVEPRLGGLYEIGFGLRPDGRPAGTHGTRILRFEPGVALDFEWQMPFFADQLNTSPLPTWVEVRLETQGDDPPQTRLRLSHRGFGAGEEWDRSYEFFQVNWFEVLFRLKVHCTYFLY